MSKFSQIKIEGTSGNLADVNSENQLHVVERGKVDSSNSTTTPLSAAGVFTGTGVDVLDYSAITILVGSDVAGSLKVQYSSDNSTWMDGETYTIDAGAEKFFTPPVQSAYYRLVYTNGGSDQTTFFIHAVLKKQAIKFSSHNITEAITDEDDAELVKAVITGKRVDGTYDNANLTNGNNLKISLEELENDISTNSNTQLKTTLYDEGGIPASVDDCTETLQTIDYAHHEIHGGSNYRVQAFNDSISGSGGTLVIGFFVPNQTKLPHMIWEFVHEGDMTMTLLEDVTLTLSTGTDVLCKNSRRDAGDTSVLQGVATGTLASYYVTKDPTYSGGTTVSLKRNYAAKNTGSEGGRRAEVILKANAYYAFVLTNNESVAQGGQIRLEWYEHADKN